MQLYTPVVTLPLKNETIKKILSFGVISKEELYIIYKSPSFQTQLSVDQKQELEHYFYSIEQQPSLTTSGFDMYCSIGSKWRDIPSTSTSINSILHGGLKQGTITEISGRGATGKTQFCMMLCATVQIPNTLACSYQAVFIDTENTFNAIRQNELLKKVNNPKATLNNIFVWKPQNLSELLELLQELPNFLRIHSNVRLIVIDSIAYFYRQFSDMIERSSKLYTAIQLLQQLCEAFPLAIVLTNHVTSYTPDTPESIVSNDQIIQPLLGPMWWHSVTTQILLSMSNEGQRVFSIKKSSYLPQQTCVFQSRLVVVL